MLHSASLTPLSTKRRADVACTVCRSRKVRCNVSSVGPPCGNCLRDNQDCMLHVPGRRRTRGPRSRQGNPSDDGAHPATVRTPPVAQLPVDQLASALPSETTGGLQDEGENIESLLTVVESPQVQSSSDLELFFLGDSKCLRFMFNVLEDGVVATNAHYWVPKPPVKPLPQEDLAFLEAKGAFTLPPEELREELIHCYFEYVHPFLPLLDQNHFLNQIASKQSSEMSILLLQSVFFAASNFADPEILVRSGISSTKALKRELYQRAKALYDLNYERDKITLIQAVLLMSYFFSDAHDRSDSWHWVGVASSLCQTIGFHRDPGLLNVPAYYRRQWKRIWWCCVHRDRWISMGMGRPTRIKMADCNLSQLTEDDLVDPNSQLPSTERYSHLVEQCELRAPLFIEALKLSMILGDVLDCQYSASTHPQHETEKSEIALASWHQNLRPTLKIDFSSREDARRPVMLLHKHMLHLLYQAVVITVHRSFIFKTKERGELSGVTSLADEALEKSSFAASMATASLTRLIGLNLVVKLPPFSVTVLSPVISIQFIERWLAKGLPQQVAAQKLELSLSVLSELSEKYWAANFNLKYFSAAFKRIDEVSQISSNPPELSSTTTVVDGHGIDQNDSDQNRKGLLSEYDYWQFPLPDDGDQWGPFSLWPA
ncbi:fungal-specific transcription factor domain-containing protein [Rhexocercosporidium sp. MPI-PUGE-AT-0058]|nr:fungal-specific transcription factor domain-containing protein [Rhexocercosporidium sp. MPI-PUGE-AT-0058]